MQGERLFDAEFELICAFAIGNEGAGLAPEPKGRRPPLTVPIRNTEPERRSSRRGHITGVSKVAQ
jgi:hypothetical protein